jgi:2-oxoisovalerate dehydrogenase E2 component (dihydrolipoyl transacylase)
MGRGETMTENTFVLPDLGEGLTEAEVLQWLVAIGDEVTVDQPVVVVETAKSTVALPVPFTGRIAALGAAAGQLLAVGSTLVVVESGEDDSSSDLPPYSHAALYPPQPGPESGQERSSDEGPVADDTISITSPEISDTGSSMIPRVETGSRPTEVAETPPGDGEPAGIAGPSSAAVSAEGDDDSVTNRQVLVGFGPSGEEEGARVAHPRTSATSPSILDDETTSARETAPRGTVAPTSASPALSSETEHIGAPRVISPVVRELARTYHVDLTSLEGSGIEGLILRRDVERAAGLSLPETPPLPPPPAEAPTTLLPRAETATRSLSRNTPPDVGQPEPEGDEELDEAGITAEEAGRASSQAVTEAGPELLQSIEELAAEQAEAEALSRLLDMVAPPAGAVVPEGTEAGAETPPINEEVVGVLERDGYTAEIGAAEGAISDAGAVADLSEESEESETIVAAEETVDAAGDRSRIEPVATVPVATAPVAMEQAPDIAGDTSAREFFVAEQAEEIAGASEPVTAGHAELGIGLGQVGPSTEHLEAVTEPVGSRRIALHGARRLAAERLTRSRREIPEATVWVDVDATALVEARAAVAAATGEAPSITALIGRYCIAGLRRWRELNARYDPETAELILNPSINLGFAVQTPDGLIVPVVRDADRLPLVSLASEIRRLTTAASQGSLTIAELTSGTFTVNNYGVFGVDGSAAIINYPEVAILGIGRIVERPAVVNGAVCAQLRTELTLAFDHRVCDGATAGGFLRYVADCVEHPLALLSDL